MNPEDPDDQIGRATVATSVNHLDATSAAERETLRSALQALIDLLFDLYEALRERTCAGGFPSRRLARVSAGLR